MEKLRVTFSRNNVKDVLEIFNKLIDEDGFIIDKDTKERILTNDLEPIKWEELGFILPGSEVFIKADSTGLAKYLEEQTNKE